MMTKFSLTILMLLNDNDVGSTSKAMSVSQILTLMDDKQRKSYSTTYRHLYNMEKLGYVKCGFVDGLASTYYISDTGKMFCKANY